MKQLWQYSGRCSDRMAPGVNTAASPALWMSQPGSPKMAQTLALATQNRLGRELEAVWQGAALAHRYEMLSYKKLLFFSLSAYKY